MSKPSKTRNPISECETLLTEGKTEDALGRYKQIMASAPAQFDLWVNYASFLYRCGQYEEAAKISQKAIEIEPRTEGYHNLASALKMLGRAEEAIEAYKKAIHHNFNSVHSHHDLAVTYESKKQLEYAIDHYQIATTLMPQKAHYWIHLANTRRQAGRYRESLSALRFALAQESSQKAYAHMHTLFDEAQDFDINSALVENVIACFKSKANDPMRLTKIVQKLFLHQDIIKTLISRLTDKGSDALKELLEDKSLNWAVFNHPAFEQMLYNLPIQGVDIETLFTALRKYFLLLTIENTIKDKLWDQSHIFLAAFACQCFLNEYVFFESEEETKQIIELQTRLENALKNNKAPDIYALCLYGCYRPLYKLKNIDYLLKNKNVSDLIRIQVQEPLEEEQSKSGIKAYTKIEDEISQLVKAQYEENPYPRWVQPTALNTYPLKDLIQKIFPHMGNDEFNAINHEKPKVLIAGCGTGRQAIEASLSFENADILALDLSASSLAYAMRKTKERGIENITYGLGDILKFRDLGEQFDLIACTGVLHHMNDPMEGWQTLNDILKPGGFMRIALYSELARKSVVAARDLIKKQGFEPDLNGIHQCREMIRKLPDTDPIKPLMRWMDFYACSTCRDLIFHAQEHRYTCPQIAQSLDHLNLDFMGFELTNPKILEFYKLSFPDDTYALDLDNWNILEQKNPDIFAEMYQFWAQKPE
ncbi:MAG: methyltransferase domain-containing protein [Alphaproteobacteria bacterium]|nr:methyltransferase domain-containing protein [Alphaproteobacteria bacterium]